MRAYLFCWFGFAADKGRHYPVKVSGVEIVPDPVVRGEPATFKISASTGKKSFTHPFIFSLLLLPTLDLRVCVPGSSQMKPMHFAGGIEIVSY